MSNQIADAVVVGGGLNGLATAWHLKRMGCPRVVLLEQFAFGHLEGSSHGRSRVTRSFYSETCFFDWMQVARRESWPHLETIAGQSLIHPHPCLLFGSVDGPFSEYAAVVETKGDQIQRLTTHQMRKQFPLFRFKEDEEGLLDGTGGIIDASGTLRALLRLCQDSGVVCLSETQMLGFEETTDKVCVETTRGTWETGTLVLTTGAWSRLSQVSLRPVWQKVVHFSLRLQGKEVSARDLPIWAWIRAQAPVLTYGFPELDSPWLKTARHLLSGDETKPGLSHATEDKESIPFLQEFLRERLPQYDCEVASTERCIYTMTPTEHFVLDFLPSSQRVVVGAGFSGHGFKFGPLTGQILAELALHGECTIPEFQQWKHLFTATREN